MITNYKHNILSVLLAGVWATQLLAQAPNFELSAPETDAQKNYVARDYIKLKATSTSGFHFSATDANHRFSAKIDAGLLFPPTDKTFQKTDGTFTTDPTQGAVVGSIPGKLNVGSSGCATYNIPIECPSGIMGMQPDLSIYYNSQGGNGPVGIGWNVGGLSAIGRATKNSFNDYAIAGINFTALDKYTLDGNDLVTLTGTYGADGSTYQTRIKNYTKVESIGQIGGISPQYFRVTSKDGRIIEYGNTTDSKMIPTGGTIPLQWFVNKVTDPNGNYMTFTYQTNGGQTVLSEIDYSGNGNKAPFTSIVFNYTTKSTIYKSYIAGYSIDDRFLLNNIQIKNNTTVLKQYSLDYNIQNSRYFLKSVTLVGLNNEKPNPTLIEWGADNSVTSVSTVSGTSIQDFIPGTTEIKWVSTDVNGDGKSDLAYIYSKVVNGTAKGFIATFLCSIDSNNKPAFNLYSDHLFDESIDVAALKNTLLNTNPTKLSADLNGDGSKFIVMPPTYQSFGGYCSSCFGYGGYGSFTFPIYKGNNNYYYCMSGTTKITSEMPIYTIADINNDGVDDIIIVEKGISNGHTILQYSNGIAHIPTVAELPTANDPWTSCNLDINSIPRDIFIADYDGDGLKDILILTDNGVKFFKNNGGLKSGDNGFTTVSFTEKASLNTFDTSYRTIKQGDFNGDGLSDFILNEHCNSNWKIALSDGNWGFNVSPLSNFTAIEEEYTPLNDDKEDCIVTDFNHDGKSDVVLIDAVYDYRINNIFGYPVGEPWGEYNKTDITWYTSTGGGFNANTQTVYDESYTYNYRNMVGDFDGDGREDIMTFGSNILNLSTTNKSSALYFYNSFNTNFEANKVKSITDGIGVRRDISYQPLTYTMIDANTTFFTKGNGLIFPLYCVSNISEPDGKGGSNITKFSYNEIVYQRDGNGFNGFKTRTISNASTNRKIVSTTDLNLNFYLPDKQTVEVSTLDNNSPISKTESYFTNLNYAYYFDPLLTKTVETNLLNGLSKTTEYEYDGGEGWDLYGNPFSIKTTQGNIITTQNLTYVQKGSWCPNKLDKITITKTKGSESIVRTIDYSYDNNGNLTGQTNDEGDTNEQSVVYSEPNQFGQPTKIQTTANGNTRTASITITSSGRFISSTTNVLGQTTSYDWGDESRGLLFEQTDHRGTINYTTHYTYNGLGQLTKTKYPTGLGKTSVPQWAANGNTYNSKFYIYSEASGSAPVYTWCDALGREIVKETTGLNGNTVRAFTEYNSNGQVYRISEPTFAGTAATCNAWATTYTEYDSFGRPTIVDTPAGQTTMSYTGTTTLVTSPNGTKQTVLNAAGQLQTSTVNGNTVTYDYYPSGLAKTSTPDGGQAISMQYDLQGNRTKLIDPDAGAVRTQYNGFGELILEKQLMKAGQDSVSTVNTYDETTGLLQTIVRGTETTSYGYDNLKRLGTIEIAGQHKQTFSYGDFDRISNVKEEIGTQVYNKQVEYDSYGRVKKELFPSGYYTTNSYDIYGNLSEVRDANRSIWKAVEANARGQLTKENKGVKQTLYGYDDRGMTTSIQTAGVVDMSYVFDSKGNLFSRTDALTNQKEQFGYDVLNRLTNWDIHQNSSNNLLKANSISYDATSGNVTTKSDLENYTMSYGGKRPDGSDIGPHALATISGVPSGTPTDNLDASYTNFKKIATLSEGTKSYAVTYGVDQQRRKSVQTVNGVTTTRYYLGDYEEEIGVGYVKKFHYLSGGAIMVNNNGVETLYYGYTDNQGSLIALTDASGNVVEKYAYDPWGARRNPTDWTQKDNRTSWITNRGYTGHEHIDAFGIINMNGRIYDPQTAMFMNTDPLVQAPDNWVNYNRYSYCYNNPLNYTDPSGYMSNTASLDVSRGNRGWQIMRDGGDYWDALYADAGPGEWAFGSGGGGGGGSGSMSGDYKYDMYLEASNQGYEGTYNEFQIKYDRESKNRNFNGDFTFGIQWGYEPYAISNKKGEPMPNLLLGSPVVAVDIITIKLSDFLKIDYLTKDNHEIGLTDQLKVTTYCLGTLSSIAPSAFKLLGAGRMVTETMLITTKFLGKSLFVVGLVFTANDIIQSKGSTESIIWGLADTSMSILGFVPGFGLVSAVYFTGRIGYQVYEEMKNEK